MTDVIIAPRVENLDSDVEAVVSGGFFQIRAARWSTQAGQWISDAWSASKTLNGAAVTVKLDAVADVPYELYMEYPDGRGGTAKRTEFRKVISSGTPVKWEDLEQVGGPGAPAALPSDLTARVAALEAALANVSGGASSLAAVSGISADAKTMIATPNSYATMRGLLGAGTSSLALGTTSTTAKAGNWLPVDADIPATITRDSEVTPLVAGRVAAELDLVRGVPGGIAELDANGQVIDASGQVVTGGGTGGTGASTWSQLSGKPFNPSTNALDLNAAPSGYVHRYICAGGVQPLRSTITSRTDIVIDYWQRPANLPLNFNPGFALAGVDLATVYPDA